MPDKDGAGMRTTRTFQGDHVIAAIIVVIIHLVTAWGLARLLRGEASTAVTSATHVTRIHFIHRPRQAPDTAMPPPTGVEIPRRRRSSTSISSPPPRQHVEPAPARSGALSAVLIGQARQWAQQQARSEAGHGDAFERANPLSDEFRPTRGHFRFREPLSVAVVVDKIGKVFGGAGYEADPCPQNRRNIAELAPQGDSAALQQEVEFERRYCRP
ncbi:MAG TPA: hypothetical protein VIT66_09190 [Lysobacter sp.]